jgi:hypothetical protein
MKRRVTLFGCAVAFASGALPGDAGAAPTAETRQACVDSYEAGQHLERDGKLTLAHQQYLVCGQPTCPDSIKTDCLQWLDALDANLPSVVLSASDESGDLTEVNVTLDDAPFAGGLDGKAKLVDPGLHTFRFEAKSHVAAEHKILIRQGEKNRVISVRLDAEPSAAATRAPLAEPPSPGRPIPAGTWILGGVGVAAVAAWGILYAGAVAKRDDLRTSCAPACATSDVDSVRTRNVIADVSLGVGIAALGAGAILWMQSPSRLSNAAQLSVRPIASGAVGAVAIQF